MAESTQQQTFQCTSCPRSFTTGRGLARHQVAHNRQEEPVSTPTETASSIRSEDPTAAIDSVIRANLPPFVPVNPIPTQAYNNIPGADFANSINAIYEEIITWKKNLFSIPSGQQGKKVIHLLSEWMTLYNNNTSFQGIALKVFMIIPALMMQKPSAKSKARIMSRYYPKGWSSGKQLNFLISS